MILLKAFSCGVHETLALFWDIVLAPFRALRAYLAPTSPSLRLRRTRHNPHT